LLGDASQKLLSPHEQNMETILTSLSLGLLATTSPCVLPLYPGFLAYISGGQEGMQNKAGRYFLGFFVLAGVLAMMLALGGIIALLSVSIGRALSIIIPFADAVIILFGILLLLNINPFKSLPQVQVPVLSHPFVNAFIYGLLYGPIALPCSGPLVVSIFALSLQQRRFSVNSAFFSGSAWDLAYPSCCFRSCPVLRSVGSHVSSRCGRA
jgi:cytochrome c-type biogenesis protein